MSAVARGAHRLDASNPDALQRDLGRLKGDLDELIHSLDQSYAPRWKPGDVYTALSSRPQLRFARLDTIDTRDGSVRAYLPLAKPKDAGLAVGFIKQIATGAVHLQPAAGALINGLSKLESLTQVGFYYLLWNGSSWWVREPSARVQAHPLTPDTLGLWQLTQRSKADSSPNGRDLTVETGTERYSYISGTLGGFYFDGLTTLWYNVADAALRLTGDLTFMCLFMLEAVTAGAHWFSHSGSFASELAADNQLFGLRYHPTTQPTVSWLQESGAGVDAFKDFANNFAPLGQVAHIAARRTSGVVRLDLHGRIWGTVSAALTTPTDGSGGRFRLGGDSATRIKGVMASAQLINRSLSDAEVMAARNYTLGGAQGYIDAF